MATFNVGSFSSTGGANLRGQSFTPNVAGPDGSGSPGTATTVYVQSASVGFPSSDTTARATTAYLYSSLPSLSNLNTGTGSLAVSTNYTDEQDLFGTGTFSRTHMFNNIAIDPTLQYFLLFPSNQIMRFATGSPYSGGKAYNTVLVALTTDVQFTVNMADSV